uniref:Uncharacterized protein n=1 Tax=Ananas comosus var. bracteatus TaxID=296719 RepID=A0A6V7QUK1_ANACO
MSLVDVYNCGRDIRRIENGFFLVNVDHTPRDLYDVPTIERSANDQEESTSTPIQENENIGDFYRIDGDKDHDDLCNFELVRADVEEIVFDITISKIRTYSPLSEDPHASTHLPSTVADRPSSPTIANPDTNTTEDKKGEVKISKRLGRAVGGELLQKWESLPMHYKDKMWDDLMREIKQIEQTINQLNLWKKIIC